MKTDRKHLAYHIVSIFVVVAMMSAVSVWAKHTPKQGPKEHNGIKFIEQNMDQATKECDDGGRGKPELFQQSEAGNPT